jgi:hypothetical protein
MASSVSFRRTSVASGTSEKSSAFGRLITVSAFAMTNTSAPVRSASSAFRIAWAPSRESM